VKVEESRLFDSHHDCDHDGLGYAATGKLEMGNKAKPRHGVLCTAVTVKKILEDGSVIDSFDGPLEFDIEPGMFDSGETFEFAWANLGILYSISQPATSVVVTVPGKNIRDWKGQSGRLPVLPHSPWPRK
jgi:hypothetical protein